jgi:hypothetical protein
MIKAASCFPSRISRSTSTAVTASVGCAQLLAILNRPSNCDFWIAVTTPPLWRACKASSTSACFWLGGFLMIVSFLESATVNRWRSSATLAITPLALMNTSTPRALSKISCAVSNSDADTSRLNSVLTGNSRERTSCSTAVVSERAFINKFLNAAKFPSMPRPEKYVSRSLRERRCARDGMSL